MEIIGYDFCEDRMMFRFELGDDSSDFTQYVESASILSVLFSWVIPFESAIG